MVLRYVQYALLIGAGNCLFGLIASYFFAEHARAIFTICVVFTCFTSYRLMKWFLRATAEEDQGN